MVFLVIPCIYSYNKTISFPLLCLWPEEKNWVLQVKRKMIYYLDGHVPVCGYEWRHQERRINTQKLSSRWMACFKECVFLSFQGKSYYKTTISVAALYPSGDEPSSIVESTCKMSTLPSKHPTQGGSNSKVHTYISQSSHFGFVLLSLGSF